MAAARGQLPEVQVEVEVREMEMQWECGWNWEEEQWWTRRSSGGMAMATAIGMEWE